MVAFVRSMHATKLPDSASSFFYHAFQDIRAAGILVADDCLLRVLSRETKSLIQRAHQSMDFTSFGSFIDVGAPAHKGAIGMQLALHTSLAQGGRM